MLENFLYNCGDKTKHVEKSPLLNEVENQNIVLICFYDAKGIIHTDQRICGNWYNG